MSEVKTMVEIGSIIRARVTRVEPYGLFLECGNEKIFIHLPETSWVDARDLRDRVTVGELLDVYVIRYNYPKRTIAGSIRRLHPEQNPYRELSRLEPGSILRGNVKNCRGNEVTVQLPNGAWGHIPKFQIQKEVKLGEEIKVIISALEVDEGRLFLEPAPQESKPSSGQAIPTPLTARLEEGVENL